ncbi:hypothetical protein ASG12_05650 [Williamsia sp. Leaf354]|nr:GMC oxidoreductase [Williamsia sp. Leaf354]KQS00391.1 hypothetical protein ASG12_05650 [Williamsia sp. Leaf354]
MLDRRAFITGATRAAAGVAATAALGPMAARAVASPVGEPAYRALVPEIYRRVPSAPAFSDTIVVGTGFGAAVTALRLGQAGLDVTVLERGSRWPIDPHRAIFANDVLPDGRGYWRRTVNPVPLTGLHQVPVDSFGGVLEATEHGDLEVWRGAGVGGGSLVFTGALVRPERRFFEAVFGSTLDHDAMTPYYARALRGLGGSPMPSDVVASGPFTHSRVWDAEARRAGYALQRIDGIWDWDIVRAELRGAVRPSAIIGESNLGNADGSKNDLRSTYLRQAEATGRVHIHPRHEVIDIGCDATGFVLTVAELAPDATVIRRRTIGCRRLFLGAGSMGTSALLVRARDTGTLPDLSGAVGEGWGTNGDAALVRGPDLRANGLVQASPSATRIVDESTGTAVSLENWYVPGNPVDLSLIGSLGMVLDGTRGRFVLDRSTGQVDLRWPRGGNRDVENALRAVHSRIAERSGIGVGAGPLARDVNTRFTAHPLGGVVLGRATDTHGRVEGYRDLYVVDGALIPGSTGTANPSLTITALAERNIEAVIAAGG